MRLVKGSLRTHIFSVHRSPGLDEHFHHVIIFPPASQMKSSVLQGLFGVFNLCLGFMGQKFSANV